MTNEPPFLKRIRQRRCAVHEDTAKKSNQNPKRNRIITFLGFATFVVASLSAAWTYHYGNLNEERAIQEQYSKLVDHTFASLPVLRQAEEMTVARITDIHNALNRPNLFDSAKPCLNDLITFASAELDAIKELSAKLNSDAFNSAAGVPADTTAAYWVERLREQRRLVALYQHYATKAYARFNSERIRECSQR